MSHPEQIAFLDLVARENRELVSNGRVLEIGSYDVNGSMRKVFSNAREYLGVDLVDGPGVDLVGYAHELGLPEASFDVVVSGECFEHDPFWRETFLYMTRAARPGGVVAFTCASTGRPEHGTTRTKVTDSPGTQSAGLDYYRNLTADDFVAAIDFAQYYSAGSFFTMPTSMDLYFAGIRAPKPEGCVAALPKRDSVARIASLMPASHRAARLPLRVGRRMLPADRYQDFAVGYWTRLDRLIGARAAR